MLTKAFLRRCVHYAGTGHATVLPKYRGIDERVVNNGFASYFTAVIDPVLTMGAERFLVHNPGGGTSTIVGDHFEIDQLNEAQRLGLIDTAEFTHALSKYRPNKIEAIVYLGDMLKNSRVQSARPAHKMQIILNAVQPVLDGKGSVCIDSSSEYTVDSFEFRMFKLLQSLVESYGGKIYAENATAAAAPHFAGIGMYAEVSSIQQVPAQRHNNEILCLVMPKPGPDEWKPERVKQWMLPELVRVGQLGYTPMGMMNGLV